MVTLMDFLINDFCLGLLVLPGQRWATEGQAGYLNVAEQ